MKILIIQSLGYGPIKKMIGESFPSLDVDYTDSFNYGIELATKNKYELVISSHMFHDKSAEHKTKKETILDDIKDGNTLGKMLKNINQSTKVYIYSEYTPDPQFIDGYILKMHNKTESLNQVKTFLKNLS